jgi:ribosome-interacting GTPase 1
VGKRTWLNALRTNRPAGAANLTREARMAEPTYEELKARLAQLEKEVETKKRSGDLVFKVGEKGGVSVYGLGRFPVTLYYEQWNRLLGAAEEIKKFLQENKSKLKLKEQG